eukprot:590885_1
MLSPSPPSMADYVELGAHAQTASPKSAANASQSHLLQPQINSMFPILDRLLKVLPTYYTSGRHRCLNVLMIALSTTLILSLPLYQLYGMIISQDRSYSELCVLIMHLFPLCCSLTRLSFFANYFDHSVNIWHFDPQNVSCVLQQSSSFKKQMREQLTTGAIIITILFSIFVASSIYNEIITSYGVVQIVWYCIHFVFSLLPDMLMICVVRIYFTECYLQIMQFTQSMNVVISFSSSVPSALLVEDMFSFKHHERYLKIYDMISSYCHQLNTFVGCWVITVFVIYWFGITLCFFTDWTALHDKGIWTGDELAISLYSQFIVFCIQAIVSALFMLWPAFKMTDSFRRLRDKISQQIQVLLKNRTYLHDDKLLDAILYNHAFKKINNTDLHKKLTVYSKQKACLEILSQLELTMNEKPCSYQLFGVSVNRYSIRDAAVALLIAKAVFFMWNGIE